MYLLKMVIFHSYVSLPEGTMKQGFYQMRGLVILHKQKQIKPKTSWIFCVVV